MFYFYILRNVFRNIIFIYLIFYGILYYIDKFKPLFNFELYLI